MRVSASMKATAAVVLGLNLAEGQYFGKVEILLAGRKLNTTGQ